jgi:hypothetical protein
MTRHFLGLGIGLGLTLTLGLTSCFLSGDDDDCMSPKATPELKLLRDCSGTYCETNADCPSDRVCNRKAPNAYLVPKGVPSGCVLLEPPVETGEGGSGSQAP